MQPLSALETAALVASGELTASQVTEDALARVAARNHQVGAFVHVAAETAREQAAQLDDRLTSGDIDPLATPVLLGVPCPIKDLTQVAGMPFEAGSALLRGNVAEVDDGIVTLLRDAGAVIVGKTATPEFGFPCYTEPDGLPPARTPWDASRSAGGSSGGAAAAVASGMVPIAQGSDGGGSIRIPASACGLVGLKPSRGRISPGPWGIDGPGLATPGVLTMTVRDTAAALDVLAQPRDGDFLYAPPSPRGYLASCDLPTEPLRIGVLTAPAIIDDVDVHEACLRAVERAADLLRGLGHEVASAPAPFPPSRWDAFRSVWAVLAGTLPLPPGADAGLTPLTRWLRHQSDAVSGVQYAQALAGVQQLTRETADAWRDVDLVLTPTLAQPPAPVGSLRDDADPASDFDAQTRFTPWTSVYNLTGRPAISLPLHRESVGGTELPLGVMLGGRLGDEATLLSVAAALEAADPWPRVAPGFEW